MLLEGQDSGVNVDWLHPSLDTIRQGLFLLPWTSYPNPMKRLVKYCSMPEFFMTESEIRNDVHQIAQVHMSFQDRIDDLHVMMKEVRLQTFFLPIFLPSK